MYTYMILVQAAGLTNQWTWEISLIKVNFFLHGMYSISQDLVFCTLTFVLTAKATMGIRFLPPCT